MVSLQDLRTLHEWHALQLSKARVLQQRVVTVRQWHVYESDIHVHSAAVKILNHALGSRYGQTTVTVNAEGVDTFLPDGRHVPARPNHTPEDVARANALGYGDDVLAMTFDHDPLHALLAHALGLSESPALRDAAEGRASEIGGAEEDVVLAMQRFVNLLRRAGVKVNI